MNNTDFYNTWKDMLAAYGEEELQFLEFNRLVPIKGNSPETFSIRLYDILQSTCGQIENMMKIICDKLNYKYPKFPPKHPSFKDFFKLLNNEGVLSQQIVYSIKNDKTLMPFIFPEDDYAPKWWKEYNNTKHNLPEGFEKGNIDNTVFALSALYSLHCIAYFIYHDSEPHYVLKKNNWHMQRDFSQNMYDEISEKEHDPRPKSEIFYNLSKFNSDGAPI